MSENQCPLCQGENACNVEDAQNCWCMTMNIPQQVKDLVPAELKNTSCICAACVEKYRVIGE
ncbi:cysteine-rich CWC family protein [Solibacillus sp. MA9]|uniref:Cysteine-rich CWC family protein n=1 Tax=Solibacillus palustris TaxID=2908203 RepID=A0ABS9UBY4_9BACL|nr:cysteine-rich CWC family protein [Solibacillus sp. MA9]MCH7321490.1 cysteine-rich CWC family protein [Solibacillus sp. MA9]